MNRRTPTFALRATIACLPLVLAACGSVNPTVFTEQEVRERVDADLSTIYKEQEAISAPIDFHEATARALKYNLDYKLKLMESALARSLHDVSTYEMLPKLVAGAGYVSRNNDSGGTSIVSVRRTHLSFTGAIAQDRVHVIHREHYDSRHRNLTPCEAP